MDVTKVTMTNDFDGGGHKGEDDIDVRGNYTDGDVESDG